MVLSQAVAPCGALGSVAQELSCVPPAGAAPGQLTLVPPKAGGCSEGPDAISGAGLSRSPMDRPSRAAPKPFQTLGLMSQALDPQIPALAAGP